MFTEKKSHFNEIQLLKSFSEINDIFKRVSVPHSNYNILHEENRL